MNEYSFTAWATALIMLGAACAVALALVRLRREWALDRYRPYPLMRLLDRLGIERNPRKDLPAADWEAALARCRYCSSTECADWLDRRRDGDGFLAFCPNAEFVRRLQRRSQEL